MAATPRFYILHGDDPISLAGALSQMRAALGDDGDMNLSDLDGANVSVAEALSAVKSLPFLADKRLVIVRGLISHITRKGAGKAGKAAVQRLLDELPNLPEHARLALVEDKPLSGNNAVLKGARSLETGYIRAFQTPKNLSAWIGNRAISEYDCEITPAAANAVASVANADVLRADSELAKLASYVDAERPIDEEDVAALTPYVPEANVFEMVDALALGDGERALRLIHRALRDRPGDPGFGLFGLITRHFRLMLMAKAHIAAGGSSQPDDLKAAMGAHRFSASKAARQSRDFSMEQLERILRHLQRVDQDVKTGRMDLGLALDLLVTSLSRV